MKLLTLIWAFVFFSQASYSSSELDTTMAKLISKLVKAQQNYINTTYPDLIKNELSSSEISKHFDPPASCDEILRDLANSKNLLIGMRPNSNTMFSIYKDLVLKSPISEHNPGVLVPLFSPKGRKSVQDVRFDMTEWEQKLRTNLGVDPKVVRHEGSDCILDISPLISIVEKAPYDLMMWHQILFNLGYPCTAKLYKNFSLKQNGQNDLTQSLFEQNMAKELPELKTLMEEKMQDVLFVHFPPLGYDIPFSPELEIMLPNKLKGAIEETGASFINIDRVSVSSKEGQVKYSVDKFKKIVETNKDKKIVVLTRSMGGMVAREVFQQNPELQKEVKGIILLGSTPYGSTIAEFKSRADVFDGVYKDIASPFYQIIKHTIGKFDNHMYQFMTDVSVRKNIGTMSHLNFNPENLQDEIPALNVILLPDNLKGYYNGSTKIAGADPTFLLMSMYGPTEGSSPLTHASWDTAHSKRIFYNKYNHLSFWELQMDDAKQLWYSTILSALDSGLIKLK